MLGGASGLRKGSFDLFYLFFYFLFLRVGVSYPTCSHRGAIWLYSSEPGFIPLSQTPSVQGFPGVGWLFFPRELFWQEEGLAFLGTTTFPCLEAKG